MSLCLRKRISELKASEFNLELSRGEGEPLVVGAENSSALSQCLLPPLDQVPSQAAERHIQILYLNVLLQQFIAVLLYILYVTLLW